MRNYVAASGKNRPAQFSNSYCALQIFTIAQNLFSIFIFSNLLCLFVSIILKAMVHQKMKIS